MPEFLITAPNGQKYRVTGDTAEGAAQALDLMLSKQAKAMSYGPQLPKPPETIGQKIYENVIGRGAVDTPGERIGQLVRGAGAGAMRGAAGLLGLPIDAANLANAGFEKVTGIDPGRVPGGGAAFQRGLSSMTGGASEYVAPGTAGKYAGTIGEFLPAALAMGASAPSAAAKALSVAEYGVAPAVASEAAGQATQGTVAEPYARVAAALLAPGAGTAVRKVISPHGGANPARIAAAKALEAEGVPVTAGQRTGSMGLRYEEATSPKMQALMENQGEAFTKAAMRRLGIDGVASPESLRRAADDIGDVFGKIYGSIDVPVDSAAARGITAAMKSFQQLTPRSSQAPVFANVAKKMTRAFKSGKPISGRQMQSWRALISKLTTSPDTATRTSAQEAIDVLDGALERTLAASGRADDVAALEKARSQWRDLLAIEKAAAGAGEAAASGILSPAQLRTAVKSQGTRQYVQGRRDLGELARAGTVALKPLPQSGTAPRIAADLARMLGPMAGGGGAGAGLGALVGGVPGAAIGGAFGAVVPKAINAAKMSRPGQAYLGNQLVSPGGGIMDKRMAAILAALMARGQQ